MLRAKSNGALCLRDSLTICSKKQSVNLLNTALGHNLVGQLKFPFLWSFLPLQSLKYCKWRLVMPSTVTIFYGFSPIFFLCRHEITCDAINSSLSVTRITTSSSMVLLCHCNIKFYPGTMVRKRKFLKVCQIKAAVIFNVG